MFGRHTICRVSFQTWMVKLLEQRANMKVSGQVCLILNGSTTLRGAVSYAEVLP